MARSNLNISTTLTEAFLSAQQPSSGVRCIKVTIEGETINSSSTSQRDGSIQSDFDSIAVSMLNENEATILLFSMSDDDLDRRNWLLVSYIPDGCKVRDKMLYSSSRDDLKRALGLGFFVAEYSANTLEEVTWDLVSAYISNNRSNDLFLSDAERSIQDEKVFILSSPFIVLIIDIVLIFNLSDVQLKYQF